MGAEQQIYFGTILLERNRWGKGDRHPSFLVSDWTERIAGDGFDGLELWENHALLADMDEREGLRSGPCPVVLLNSYAGCENEDLAARQQTAQLASFFDAGGMKFNFGKFPERQDLYIDNVKAWSEMFKPGYRMLSENHRGTTTADAKLAADTYERLEGVNIGGIIHFDDAEEVYRQRFGCYGRYLTHIHCKLSSDDGLVMSEDAVRHRLNLLREFGFNGTFTIEFTEGMRVAGVTIDELYRNAVRDLHLLRGCLEALY